MSICIECWEPIPASQTRNLCSHCWYAQQEKNKKRPWYRYGQRHKDFGGGWYAHEVIQILLALVGLCGLISFIYEVLG